jgi:two-component system response regulator YesN
MAERLHISPSYFRTIFKRETGKTFHHYLTAYRMDRAMELLRATDLKTAHIAERIGISEASYFSYSFKKHFGASPSQVRKDAGNA